MRVVFKSLNETPSRHENGYFSAFILQSFFVFCKKKKGKDMFKARVDSVYALQRRLGKSEDEAWKAVGETKDVIAMATFILAAPGLMSSATHAYVHKRLLAKGYLGPAGHGGRFTWDGYENAITVNPRWGNSFTWIDYVLWVHGSSAAPSYMDNRVIRLASDVAFPELTVALTRGCTQSRWWYDRRAAAAIKLQRHALRASGLCALERMPCKNPAKDDEVSNMTDYNALIDRLRQSLQYKGGVPSRLDDKTLLGASLFSYLRSYEGLLTSTPIPELLDPLLAPLLSESSDHYAVLSHITFPSSSTRHAVPFWESKGVPPSRSASASVSVSEAGVSAVGRAIRPYPPAPRISSETSARAADSAASPFSTMGGAWTVRPAPPHLKSKLRILSQNMHFRPYDTRTSRVTNLCDADSMAMNMQELRARVFVRALAKMQASEFPHVICLQETQHEEANAILTAEMRANIRPGGLPLNCVTSKTAKRTLSGRPDVGRGFSVWSGLQIWTSWTIRDSLFVRFTETLLDSTGALITRAAISLKRPLVAAGGLLNAAAHAITSRFGLVRESQESESESESELELELVSDSDSELEFDLEPKLAPVPSAGADKILVNKGMLYALLEEPGTGRLVRVVVTHPSPYVKVGLHVGIPKIDLDSHVDGVAHIHRAQITALANLVSILKKDATLEGVPIFVTGDLNINKYATRPDTDAEKDADGAAQAGRSREFGQVLRKLNAIAPAFTADSNTDRWVPRDKIASALHVEELLQKTRKA